MCFFVVSFIATLLIITTKWKIIIYKNFIKKRKVDMFLKKNTVCNILVSPLVSFTGRSLTTRRNWDRLLETPLNECYNDAELDRTEPCIALYPTGNAVGSWNFLNIATNHRVSHPCCQRDGRRQDGFRTAPTVANSAVQSADVADKVPDLLGDDDELEVPRHYNVGDEALIDQVAWDVDLQTRCWNRSR